MVAIKIEENPSHVCITDNVTGAVTMVAIKVEENPVPFPPPQACPDQVGSTPLYRHIDSPNCGCAKYTAVCNTRPVVFNPPAWNTRSKSVAKRAKARKARLCKASTCHQMVTRSMTAARLLHWHMRRKIPQVHVKHYYF